MSLPQADATQTPRQAPSARAKIQAFGGFLTAMVIPNVAAFIAWGLITALFIPTGWLPNEHIGQLVDPMVKYLLPLLLAFTGGTLVHGHRGGVAGAIATIGVIIGAEIPMFLGAMVLGPLAAWIMKKFDSAIENHIPSGFEMVVNNFSLGIIGMGMTLISFLAVGPLIEEINQFLVAAITSLVSLGILPILSIINEPAKVLFLNNVIDQGIYYPLGTQQTADLGKSIFFTVASNPGPGLGLLLAFWLFGHDNVTRTSAPGAIIIHFFGGIHEIYFPYVLMKPSTILGMIAGGMSGIMTFSLFDAGLVAGPSPGSIFSYILLTPKGSHLGIIAGVVVATTVSFLVTATLLKFSKKKTNGAKGDDLAAARTRTSSMKAEGKTLLNISGTTYAPTSPVNKVVFACDAGMGSSTMGAGVFRKKLGAEHIDDIEVANTSIEKIPADADVVVVHENLADRTHKARPGIRLVTISNYLNDPAIDNLLNQLSSGKQDG